MTAKTNLAGADNFVLQSAISAYSDEAYTNAKKLTGTGIVGVNPNIDVSTETFIGQVRWFKPMNPTINVASLTDSTNGTGSTYSSDYVNYIKTVRTYGAEKVNLQSVVTQQDGLAKIGRDFAEHRANDEHNALLAVLRGVMISELLNGTAVGGGGTGLGGQTFTNDPTDKKFGFYVDLGSNKLVSDAGKDAGGTANAAYVGAARADKMLQAFGMAFKDYEPEYAYLVASPELMASFRSANLVDSDKVSDGSINFSTLFQGKFRLIQTRASQGLSSAEITKLNTGAGVDLTAGAKTAFLVLPGAVAMQPLMIPEPVEIQRVAAAYKGGGTTTIWNRWGYVLHPAGYDWKGPSEAFPSNADYQAVMEAGNALTLSTATNVLTSTTSVWQRKASSALSLGILPIFYQ